MDQNPSTTTEQSTSERFSELWQALNHNQRRFAVAMLECNTKAEGADAIGLKPDTVYRWGKAVDVVIDLLIRDATTSAVGILTSALHKAVMVKIAGMDDDDTRVRQDAASEIIDRVLGRASQPLEHTGKDGGPIETTAMTLAEWKVARKRRRDEAAGTLEQFGDDE